MSAGTPNKEFENFKTNVLGLCGYIETSISKPNEHGVTMQPQDIKAIKLVISDIRSTINKGTSPNISEMSKQLATVDENLGKIIHQFNNYQPGRYLEEYAPLDFGKMQDKFDVLSIIIKDLPGKLARANQSSIPQTQTVQSSQSSSLTPQKPAKNLLEDQVKKLEGIIIELQARIGKSDTTIIDLKEQNERISKELTEAKSGSVKVFEQNNKLVAELADLRKLKGELEQQISAQVMLLKQQGEKITDLQGKNDSLSRDLSDKEALLQRQRQEFDEQLRASAEGHKQELAGKDQEISRLTQQLETMNAQIAERSQSDKDLDATQKAKIEELQAKFAKILQENSSLDIKIGEATDLIGKKDKEIGGLLNDNKQQAVEIIRLTESNSQKELIIAELKEQLLKSQQNKAQTEQEVGQANAKVAGLEQSLAQISAEKNDLSEQLKVMQERMAKLEANFQSQLEISIGRLAEINNLTAANEQLAQNKAQIEMEKTQAETKVSIATEKLAAAKATIERMKREDAQIEEWRKMTKEAESQARRPPPTLQVEVDKMAPKAVAVPTLEVATATDDLGLLAGLAEEYKSVGLATGSDDVESIVDYGKEEEKSSKAQYKPDIVAKVLKNAGVQTLLNDTNGMKLTGEGGITNKAEFHGEINDDKIVAAVALLNGVANSNEKANKSVRVSISDFEDKDILKILDKLYEKGEKEFTGKVKINYKGISDPDNSGKFIKNKDIEALINLHNEYVDALQTGNTQNQASLLLSMGEQKEKLKASTPTIEEPKKPTTPRI